MKLRWTPLAVADLNRVFEFLAPVNRREARVVLEVLRSGALKLCDHPQLGAALDGFGERDVRHIFINHYELRYEVRADTVWVLRVFHMRELR